LRRLLAAPLLALAVSSHASAAVDGTAIEAALAALHGADLAVVDAPVAGREPSAVVATRVAAPWAALAAVLTTPSAYREAVPALVRVQVVEQRRTGGVQSQLIEWELEIPLFNLKGKAWIRPRIDGVDLDLVEGNLAPGKVAFTWITDKDGAGTILALESQVNVRAAGWLFRQVVSRSPYGAGAMNLTAAYVLLRAAAERAVHPADARARRPQSAPLPPALPALVADAPVLGAGPALAPFLRRGAVAAVRRSASGRLVAATVAAPFAAAAGSLLQLLARSEAWSAFPGWHTIQPIAGDRMEVEDNLPLVDFDATWQLHRDRAAGFSAVASDGAIRGALFGWDVYPGAAGAASRSVGVLSLYPRLEASGYVPRKFIAAEPLLEHGMALALAYVDAMSMAARLQESP